MVKLPFSINEDTSRLYMKISSDPDDAAKFWLIVATSLEKGEPIPYQAAFLLRDALRAAMVKPKKDRVKELGHEMFLTTRDKRYSGNWYLIGKEFDETRKNDRTDTITKNKISDKYGISDSTALRYWTKYKRSNGYYDIYQG